MLFSNRPLWIFTFFASFHINLAIPAPLYPNRPNMPLSLRGNMPSWSRVASWPSNHSPAFVNMGGQEPDYVLPPVAEVLKHMAAHSTMPHGSITHPTPTSLLPTKAVGEPVGVLEMIGPGIVIVPSTSPSPFTITAARLSPSASSAPNAHPYPAPVRRLVIIGSVFGAILVLSLAIFVLVNRHAVATWWRKKTSPRETWMKLGVPIDGETEKDLPTPPWLKLTSPVAPRSQRINPVQAETEVLPRAESKVIDIAPLQSKFSVSSSDYTSPSPSPSFTSALSTILQVASAPPALLPPSEFFSLPSASDLESPRHSRIQSAPVFGHAIPFSDFPPSRQSTNTLRSGEHRKSKSVSGLAYIVPPSTCDYPDRTDSSDWSGSPTGTNNVMHGP